MLVAQASDLHLRADPAHASHASLARLLNHLTALKPLPDLLVLSGDLADDGDIDSYRHLRAALEHWPGALQLTAGNHDDRGQLLRVFPEMGTNDGFLQSTAEFKRWRLILIDTLAPGKVGGGFLHSASLLVGHRSS